MKQSFELGGVPKSNYNIKSEGVKELEDTEIIKNDHPRVGKAWILAQRKFPDDKHSFQNRLGFLAGYHSRDGEVQTLEIELEWRDTMVTYLRKEHEGKKTKIDYEKLYDLAEQQRKEWAALCIKKSEELERWKAVEQQLPALLAAAKCSNILEVVEVILELKKGIATMNKRYSELHHKYKLLLHNNKL